MTLHKALEILLAVPMDCACLYVRIVKLYLGTHCIHLQTLWSQICYATVLA